MGALVVRGRARGARRLVLIVLLGLLGSACSSAPEPVTGSPVVHFTTSDGVRLEGRLFGAGRTGVVLSHMFPADESSWFDFAATLSDSGYRALAFDFRGYCPGGAAGCSQGEKTVPDLWKDVVAAVGFFRSRGVKRVLLVGASMGGTASLIAAAQEGVDASAVVTLSAPTDFEGLAVDPSTVQRVTAPKLFVAGLSDPAGAAQAAQTLYDESGGARRIEIVPTSDHGTDLLTGSRGEQVRTLVLGYLQQYREAP